MGAIEQRGQVALVAFHLTPFAVAVEIALGGVVDLTVGVVVDRAGCGPFIG